MQSPALYLSLCSCLLYTVFAFLTVSRDAQVFYVTELSTKQNAPSTDFFNKNKPYATTTGPGRGRHAVDDGRMIFQGVSVILKCLLYIVLICFSAERGH